MTSRRQALQAIVAGGLLLPQLGHAAPAPRKLERGVALGLFHEDPLWSYRGLLKELADLSASHVSLVPAYYQEHAGSTEIGSHPRFSVPDETIRRTISEAHALGLQVLLFPIVRLAQPRRDSEWRGTLQPSDRKAWWQSYERLTLHLAKLAQQHKVAQFSVGSELSTLDGERDRPDWERLVGKVRGLYQGRLTYSGTGITSTRWRCTICATRRGCARTFRSPAGYSRRRCRWKTWPPPGTRRRSSCWRL
jgi:hypothetical protein